MNNKFPQTDKSISIIDNPVTESLNTIKSDIDITNTNSKYSIIQCISADLLHNCDLSKK